jgi:hypothetical protein
MLGFFMLFSLSSDYRFAMLSLSPSSIDAAIAPSAAAAFDVASAGAIASPCLIRADA